MLQQGKLFHLAVTFKGCCLFVSWSKTYMGKWLQVCYRTKLYKCILTIFICREKSVCCEASCRNLRASSHHSYILGMNDYHLLQWEFHISVQTERLETSTSINIILFIFKAGLFYCSKHKQAGLLAQFNPTFWFPIHRAFHPGSFSCIFFHTYHLLYKQIMTCIKYKRQQKKNPKVNLIRLDMNSCRYLKQNLRTVCNRK